MELREQGITFRIIPDGLWQDPDLRGSLVVWCALAYFARSGGTCHPSQAQLEDETGMSIRSIREHIKKLEVAGWIEVIRSNEAGKANIYILHYNAGQSMRQNPACGEKLPTKERDSVKDSVKDSNVSILEGQFASFYEAYPRPMNRGEAFRAYRGALKKISATDLQTAVELYARYWAKQPKDKKQYIPYPAKWLNNEKWLEPVTVSEKPDWLQAMGRA